MMRLVICIVCIISCLTACEANPTPFPAQIPTATPDTIIPSISPTPPITTIRYGIDPSLRGMMLPFDDDATVITSTVPITPADLEVTYDIAIRLGDANGWSRLPHPMTIGMIIHPAYPFADLIWRAIDPPEWITSLGLDGALPLHDGTTPITILRADMANLGKPDGFTVKMGVQHTIGELEIQNQLSNLFIEIHPVSLSLDDRLTMWHDGGVDLMLVAWFSESEKVEWTNLVGEANLLPLFIAPLSYIASSKLTITLSETGLPRVTRP